MSHDANHDAYADPSIVEHYARQTELFRAEAELLEHYGRLADSDVLDLGIGGGRTTRLIAPACRSYVGIDYIAEMVEAANETTCHEWDLRHGDASDLSAFKDETFDLLIFSFNGIGTLPTTEARLSCLAEVRRVLRPGGGFLFSVGNASYLKLPPGPDAGPGERIRSVLGYAHHVRQLAQPVFWRGRGWRTDVVLGKELHTYGAHPRFVHAELESAGLPVQRTLNGLYPLQPRSTQTPWWYYFALKN